MPKANPPKKQEWQRVESWLHLKKILLLGGLGLSNLAVLGFVFGVYLQSRAPGQRFYSAGDDQLDYNFQRIERELKENCADAVRQVKESGGQRYCKVTLPQRYGSASYTVRPRFLIEKSSEDGKEKIVFRSENSKIQSGTGFADAAEGDYCQNCAKEVVINQQPLADFMEEFIELAQDNVYGEMRRALETEKSAHESKVKDRRDGQRKERACEGNWDEDEEYFTPFSFEEQMGCETNKLSQVHPLERDRRYYSRIQPRLWEAVRSDDDKYFLDESFWNKFNDPYRFSFSIRSSAGLLRRYNSDWKETFEGYESEPAKQAYLRAVRAEARDYLNLMPREHAGADLHQLNRGFQGYKIFRQDSSPSGGPAGTADQLIQGTRSLY